MTTKYSTKKALISSIVVIALCLSMLIGTTFAWFTDSATSAGNIIKTGNLDVELYWANGAEAVPTDREDWTNAKSGPLYKEDQIWEPGYTDAKHIMIANNGSLALKYQLAIIPEGEVSALADVIDVYFIDGGEQLGGAYDLSAYAPVGTLRDVINSGIKQGSLEAGKTFTTTIVLAMRTTAGNEYQNLAIGTSFSIKLLATQFNLEPDSFGPDYDKNAWVSDMKVYTAENLVNAIENAAPGDVITLENDIEVEGTLVIPGASGVAYFRSGILNAVTVDLNGNTLTADYITTDGDAVISNGIIELPADGYVYTTDGAAITLRDITVVSDGISAYAAKDGILALDNVKFENEATSNPIQNYGGTLLLDEVKVVQSGTTDPSWYSSTVQTINYIKKNEETGKYEILAQANTTINSGVYTGKKALMISAPGGNVTINGGEFIGTEYVIQDDFAPQNYTYGSEYQSIISINDGNFVGNVKLSAATQLVIRGGTFTFDPTEYVADGFYTVKGENNWSVLPMQEGIVYPADYDALMSGKNYSNSYVLNGNITVNDKIYLGDNTSNIINLNNRVINSLSSYVFATQGAGCYLEINGNGTVKNGSGYAALANKNSKLVINGGDYELGAITQAAHFYCQNSATIVINGGNFISTDADTPILYCINGFIEINGGFFQNTANSNQALLSMSNNIKYANNQKITLSGGTFVNWNPLDSAFARPWTNPDVPALIVLAEGYQMISETQANGDVWYTVVPI